MSQQDASGIAAPTPARFGTVERGSHRAARRPGSLRRLAERAWTRETLVLLLMLAAGVAATWPRASFLTGRLPLNSDQSQDVWSLWWVARQITHLRRSWCADYLAFYEV